MQNDSPGCSGYTFTILLANYLDAFTSLNFFSINFFMIVTKITIPQTAPRTIKTIVAKIEMLNCEIVSPKSLLPKIKGEPGVGLCVGVGVGIGVVVTVGSVSYTMTGASAMALVSELLKRGKLLQNRSDANIRMMKGVFMFQHSSR